MFNLNIVVGPSVISLVFKEAKDAAAAYTALDTSPDNKIAIIDDFGQSAVVVKDKLSAYVLEDTAKAGDAQIAKSIAQAKLQMKLNTVARNDPALKAMNMMSNMVPGNGMGPSVPRG